MESEAGRYLVGVDRVRRVGGERPASERHIFGDVRESIRIEASLGLAVIQIASGQQPMSLGTDVRQLHAQVFAEPVLQQEVVVHGALGAKMGLKIGFETLWGFDKPNPAMTFIPLLLAEPLAETLLAGREEAFLRHLWNAFTHNKDRVPFDAWQPYVEAMKRPGLARSSAGYYRAAYDGAHAVRSLIEAGKLMMPVLSVSGQASFGPDQRPFFEAFAGNIREHLTVENSGHFVAEEQPEALIAALRSFLAG